LLRPEIRKRHIGQNWHVYINTHASLIQGFSKIFTCGIKFRARDAFISSLFTQPA
jgi:hypothetical protein